MKGICTWGIVSSGETFVEPSVTFMVVLLSLLFSIHYKIIMLPMTNGLVFENFAVILGLISVLQLDAIQNSNAI